MSILLTFKEKIGRKSIKVHDHKFNNKNGGGTREFLLGGIRRLSRIHLFITAFKVVFMIARSALGKNKSIIKRDTQKLGIHGDESQNLFVLLKFWYKNSVKDRWQYCERRRAPLYKNTRLLGKSC